MAVWQPTDDDLQRVFDEQNPWHASGVVPESLARRVRRPLAQLLWRRLLDDRPHRFQLVLGPRRVGKTTALYQTVQQLLDAGVDARRIWWMRLDHPLLLQQRLDDLVRLVVRRSGATAESPVYLMLDELVYSADWDLWLKTFFDDRWPVRIAATSSASAALRERRLESGVGRWAEQHLTPYLVTELLDLVGQPESVDVGSTLGQTLRGLLDGQRASRGVATWRRALMLAGGFPELLEPMATSVIGSDEPNTLLRSQQILRSDAVERAVYKDIPQSFDLDNPMMLERLLYVLAAQMTGLLSPTKIGRDLGISQPTFDRYLAYLERAFLVFALPNYAGSESTVQRRGRKLYFVDGAVRNAALQRGLAPLDDPAELGVLMENLVASTTRTLALHSGVRLFHWRDGRDEVDLVFDHPDDPVAFEISSSDRHSRRGLISFCERYPQFRGRAYFVSPQAAASQPSSSTSHIGSLPLDLLLLALGGQGGLALSSNLAG